MDYKYFAGSKDPIEIILKYRMRGFGTFLNRKEIDKAIKYIQQIPFWNNLYSINPDNKDTIKSSLGWLEYKHKLYHPRLFNMDLFLGSENPIGLEQMSWSGLGRLTHSRRTRPPPPPPPPAVR